MNKKINSDLQTHVGSKFVQDVIRTFISTIRYLFYGWDNFRIMTP